MRNSLILTRYNRAKASCIGYDSSTGCFEVPVVIGEAEKSFFLQEFLNKNNGELLSSYGKLVNRTLSFIHQYYDGIIPDEATNTILLDNLSHIYNDVGAKIERGQYQAALEVILEFIRYGNRYYEINDPSKTIETEPETCGYILLYCTQVIANLAVLLHPFLPFSLDKIFVSLSLSKEWSPQYVKGGYCLPVNTELFEIA